MYGSCRETKEGADHSTSVITMEHHLWFHNGGLIHTRERGLEWEREGGERERERERERLCSMISVNISRFLVTIARCAPGVSCTPVGTGGRAALVRG